MNNPFYQIDIDAYCKIDSEDYIRLLSGDKLNKEIYTENDIHCICRENISKEIISASDLDMEDVLSYIYKLIKLSD